MEKIEIYERNAVFAELNKFCSFAKEDDFIEVTEWKNCEGYDVCIENSLKCYFQITRGQFKALKKLIKILDK